MQRPPKRSLPQAMVEVLAVLARPPRILARQQLQYLHHCC